MDRRRLTSASASTAELSAIAHRQAIRDSAADTDPAREPRQPQRDAIQSPAAEPRIERIARRAHEIYEARGGTEGRALEDWLQAEREIDAES